MTKFNLTYDDRIQLIYSTFQPNGNVLTLRAVRDLTEAVKLTPEEETECKFTTQPDGRLSWSTIKGTKEFDFLGSWVSTTKARLEELDRTQQLKIAQLPLYDLFVIPEDKAEDKED